MVRACTGLPTAAAQLPALDLLHILEAWRGFRLVFGRSGERCGNVLQDPVFQGFVQCGVAGSSEAVKDRNPLSDSFIG